MASIEVEAKAAHITIITINSNKKSAGGTGGGTRGTVMRTVLSAAMAGVCVCMYVCVRTWDAQYLRASMCGYVCLLITVCFKAGPQCC